MRSELGKVLSQDLSEEQVALLATAGPVDLRSMRWGGAGRR